MGNIRGGTLGFHGTIGQPTAQVIDGSLKFQNDNSTYLTRTPSSAGNRSVYTGSVWVKRTEFAPENNSNSNAYNYTIFSAGTNSANNMDNIKFYKNAGTDDANKIEYGSYTGSYQYLIYTNAKYRDPSGWYNVVWNYDGTTAKLYVNGEQITSFDTNTQNGGSSGHFNNNVAHVIGHTCDQNYSSQFDGYMSQFYWIDGLSLGPGYFGFTDPLTNTWRPKKFRAKGTTINDGTVWSNSLTTNAGDNFDGSGAKTKAFDGNGSNKAFTANNSDGTTQGTSYLEMVFPSPISGVLRVKCDNGNTVRNTSNGKDIVLATQSTGSDNQFVHCGTVSGLTNLRVLMSGGSRPAISIIEVDGVVMQDSTTTNLAFGTNGFYLPMDNQDDFEKDKSGNGNDFTKNNFSGTSIDPDVVKDSPSGAVFGGRGQTGITTTSSAPANYAVLNVLNKHKSADVMSNGNLDFTTSTGGGLSTSTLSMSYGKFYFESVFSAGAGSQQFAGIRKPGARNYSDSYIYVGTGNKYTDGGSATSYGDSLAHGDYIGTAFDATNGTLEFFKNGVSQGIAFTGISGSYLFFVGSYGASPTYKVNFGQKPFKYAPPQGYLPLNSVTARPNKVIPRPDQYVGVTTFTGNGGTQSIDVGHEPDLVWLKDRGAGEHHGLFDTIRGPLMRIVSDYTYASTSRANTVTSFNYNGVTLGSAGEYNGNNDPIVCGSWKAGGSRNTFNVDDVGYATAAAAGLDGGDLTITGASVGTKQGFSIIKYTGSGNAGDSASHGLLEAPKFIITKNIDNGTYSWRVFTTVIDGSNDRLLLDGTNAKADQTDAPVPTSSVFYVGANLDHNKANDNIIAYLWHDVPGLQKFGSYTGNNSTDGITVELGFRPALVWYKRTDSTGNWVILDTKRTPFNPAGTSLYADTADADYSPGNPWADILSTGFKIRASYGEINGNSASYIYCAWAEATASNLFGGQSNAR